MKNLMSSFLNHRHSSVVRFGVIPLFFLALNFCLPFGISSQTTLCQQLGEPFTPNVIIGTSASSVTNTSGLGIAGWSNLNILINGTLNVNSNFQIENCKLKMGPSASIVVLPTGTFASYTSKYFNCTSLWAGFVFNGGSSIFAFNHLEDANIAFNVKSANASITMLGNYINRNNYGLRASGIAVNVLMAANTIDCSSAINGGIGSLATAGVDLTDCPSAAIGLTQNIPGYRNNFKNSGVV